MDTRGECVVFLSYSVRLGKTGLAPASSPCAAVFPRFAEAAQKIRLQQGSKDLEETE